MRFRRVHIDGFGIWRDLTVELDPALNVFVAPNEGGKTTLMSFVRAVLFGFRRRNDPQRYEPLRGGKHGGWLEVEAGDDSYRIVRTADGTSSGGIQVLADDGSRLPDGTLRDLLHSTSDELFGNVFAFGLGELQVIDTLQGDEVAGHIYSAGMTGGSADPIAFRQSLEADMKRLYRPRGRNQRVPALLEQLQGLQQKIEELQRLPAEHARLLRQRDELRQDLEEADQDADRLQLELDAGRRARRAWRDYEDLLAAESALRALGVPLEREDGGDRALADPAEVLSDEQRSLLREAGRIRSLLASTPRLRELQAAVQKHDNEADTARAALEIHLRDLGTGWTVERIRAVETGLEVREAIRRHGESLREAQGEIETIASRAADAHEAYEGIVNRSEPVGGEVVMLTWAIAAALTLLSAVVVPGDARLVATAAVGAAGAVAGIASVWLRRRGRQQLEEERVAAADRETTLWSKHEIAERKLEGRRKAWSEWLAEQGFDPTLTVDGSLDLVDRIREAQELARQERTAKANVDRAKSELTVACGRVNALLQSLDRTPVPVGKDPLGAVEHLLGQLETLQAELESAEDQRVRMRTVLDQFAQAHAALRAVAGDEGAGALRRRLEDLDPDRVERLVKSAETAVSEARKHRDRLNEQLGGIAERVAHLEQNTELDHLLQRREQLRTGLRSSLVDWAGYAAAAALFDSAKKIYEEQRQPEVLKRASEYFRVMTDGRYGRVLAPLGETNLEVQEARSGRRKPPEALSRGTREQLYLAMRLALAAVYARQAVALPLVADDILVNFDDVRAAATAGLLGRYADNGAQVLAFTCHERLAAVFRNEAPAARILELPSPH